ncbi:uncharacterized protein DEA37_0003180, partial [Paragonimus westermani]
FEKMRATPPVGELARLLVIETASKKLPFNGEIPEKFTHLNSFASQFLFGIDKLEKCGACVCLTNRMGRRRVTISVDGAFFRFSSIFTAILVEPSCEHAAFISKFNALVFPVRFFSKRHNC